MKDSSFLPAYKQSNRNARWQKHADSTGTVVRVFRAPLLFKDKSSGFLIAEQHMVITPDIIICPKAASIAFHILSYLFIVLDPVFGMKEDAGFVLSLSSFLS